MADKIVRRNNDVGIDWKIKNYLPKTVVGLTVDTDPGAGFGTVAVAPAPDANTKSNGAGSFHAVMPQLGTFVFTLTVKKPKGDETKQQTVVVEELTYKSLTAAARVEVGHPVALSWEIEVADGCTFKLSATDPANAETLSDVQVDAKGKGSFSFTPKAVGVHTFKLLCTDPTLKAGQASPASPVVQVEARDPPVLHLFYDDFAKPTLELDFEGTALTSAPGYKLEADPTFKATGEFKKADDFDKTGNWKAVQAVPAASRIVHVEIFKSAQEAKTPGSKPIAQGARWFHAAKPGDSPVLMATTMPDRTGKLGTPFLDDPRIAALGLSAKRIKMIKDFLPQIMPSTVGSAAFDKIAPKSVVDANVAAGQAATPPRAYTTCGEVPPFLSRQYKEPKHPFMMGGLIGCYWAATDAKAFAAGKPAWVAAESGLAVQPAPGDLFIITDAKTTPDAVKKLVLKLNAKGERTDAFVCLHVGVIVDAAPGEVTAGGHPMWIVCQAGMGTQEQQKAAYERVSVDPDAKGGPLLGSRRLAGWINIDNYLHWT